MDKVVLVASKRVVTGKKVNALRRAGNLPAVLYGHNFAPQPISLNLKETTAILQKISGSSIITIDLDGKEHAALVREKQRDFVKNVLLHVDFQTVSLTEKLRTEVAIILEGIAPAVKDFNAMIGNGISEIEVECFPQDLPESIKVDISILKEIGDAIYVKDLPVPANVEFLTDGEELVAITSAVKEEKEEEVEAEVVEPVAGEPEVIEKGKKEEEIPE